ncbi:hypothetical protein [Serratia marcescens]|uniref:hypothetical protein n=1 Tax=Serratia marcescens TaxID=615 RepID=UPI003204B59B
MLDGYFKFDEDSLDIKKAKHKKLLALQAALEIAKASVSGATAISGVKSGYDLDNVTDKVEKLAKEIQSFLDK